MTANNETVKLLEIPVDKLPIAQRNIFRPYGTEGKFKTWIRKRLNRYLYESSPPMKRYLRIHVFAKRRLFQNAVKIMRRVLKNYLIKDIHDIPKFWYNNHLRIFYYSFNKGLEDGFRKFVWETKSKDVREKYGNDSLRFYKEFTIARKYWRWENRKDVTRILMTEFLEDTFDREWINFTMMRMAHEMMKFYGVSENERLKVPQSGQYPIYFSGNEKNPEYQLLAEHPVIGKVWGQEEEIYDGTESKNKESDKGSKGKKVKQGQTVEKSKSSKS